MSLEFAIYMFPGKFRPRISVLFEIWWSSCIKHWTGFAEELIVQFPVYDRLY